jgi:hypothetical protein
MVDETKAQSGLSCLLKNPTSASALKGHGFIRADKANQTDPALAAEGAM